MRKELISKYYLGTLFMLSFLSPSIGQDLKKDIDAIAKKYQNIKDMDIHVTTNYYKHNIDSKPYSHVSGRIVKQGAYNYYYAVEFVTIVVNSKQSLMVNSKKKVIVYGNLKEAFDIDKLRKSFDMKIFNQLVDTTFSKNKYNYKAIGNSKKHYSIYAPSNKKIDRYEIFFDDLKKVPYQTTVYFKENAATGFSKMEMEMDINETVPDNNPLFKVDDYVRVDGNKVKLTEKYKNYKLLINYTL